MKNINTLFKNNNVTSIPKYDRSKLDCGILHMSVGGFHRAHQAYYLNEYLQLHNENWMIYGVGCLDQDIDLVKKMNNQDNMYSLTTRSGSQDDSIIIGSMKEFVHAPSDPQIVIDQGASDNIKIISLTITEKGYYYNSSQDLDFENTSIIEDLKDDNLPKTAIGYLFAIAEKRMINGGQAFTIMSCDNLPGNGKIAERILLQFSDKKNSDVGDWIRKNVSFPNSMVDRITPAVTDSTIEFIKNERQIDDACGVVSESFIQWILEDDFINGRPKLEEVGVQFVKDVDPYEKLKVRMLNGSHSALSYVSYLMGYRDVDVAMSDPLIGAFVESYMAYDITPTIPQVPGVDVSKYKDVLIERFSNSAVRDQIQRLAMDGSGKIPNAIVPALKIQLENDGSIKWIVFALASWFRYLSGVDENGESIEITDPTAAILIKYCKDVQNNLEKILGIQEIFGTKLVGDVRLLGELKKTIDSIYSLGTKIALQELLDEK